MASANIKILALFALIAALALTCSHVNCQDYDDEGSQSQGNDGFGGYSGNDGDDDYAAPRDQSGSAGADQSEQNPRYQGDDSSADGYDDSAAAASAVKPTLTKLIRQASK